MSDTETTTSGQRTMKTDLELIQELVGQTCFCGNIKSQGMSFCRSCYFSLPVNMRYDLYKRPGKGYREAHEVAVYFLVENV
jgi:hypothetical protein